GAYAEGAKRGAPRAKQIADRYHLLVNLRDAIKDGLARSQDRLPILADERTEPSLIVSAPTRAEEMVASFQSIPVQASEQGERGDVEPAAQARPLTVAEQRRQISRAHRLARYEPAGYCSAPAHESAGGSSLSHLWQLSRARSIEQAWK